jgi:hypothetical protein
MLQIELQALPSTVIPGRAEGANPESSYIIRSRSCFWIPGSPHLISGLPEISIKHSKSAKADLGGAAE